MNKVLGNDTWHCYLSMCVWMFTKILKCEWSYEWDTYERTHTHTHMWQVVWRKEESVSTFIRVTPCDSVTVLTLYLIHCGIRLRCSPRARIRENISYIWTIVIHSVCVCTMSTTVTFTLSQCMWREKVFPSSVLLFTASRRQIIIVVASLVTTE